MRKNIGLSLRRRDSKKYLAAWAVLLPALLPIMLVGCGGGKSSDIVAQPFPCPTIAVLGDTDRVTLFRDQGRDLTDILYQAELNQAVTRCEYDLDEGVIHFDVAFEGKAALGPAAQSRNANLKLFMAVTETDQRVVRKTVIDVPVEFEDSAREVGFVQTVEESVLPYVEGFDGSAYQILIGFQLTRDQLAHNRQTARN